MSTSIASKTIKKARSRVPKASSSAVARPVVDLAPFSYADLDDPEDQAFFNAFLKKSSSHGGK